MVVVNSGIGGQTKYTSRLSNYLNNFLTKSGMPVELLCAAVVSFVNVLSSSIMVEELMGFLNRG
jgi:hypothetical protein